MLPIGAALSTPTCARTGLLAFGTRHRIATPKSAIASRRRIAGAYAIPPAQAEAMYHQKIRARGVSGTLTVTGLNENVRVSLYSGQRKWASWAAGAFAVVIAVVPKPHLLDETSFSPCYVDRNGKLLRLGLAEDDRYRVYVPLEKISPQLIEMTLLHEDRYFHEHVGFNPFALVRAAWSDLRGQGRRLGASTITMQLARLHYHLNTRTIGGKLCRSWRRFIWNATARSMKFSRLT